MRETRKTRSLLLTGLSVLALSAGIGACSHQVAPTLNPAPKPAPAAPPAPTRATAPLAPHPVTPAPPVKLTEDEIFSRKTVDELNSETPLGDAYFAFDKARITPTDEASLAKDADWLKRRGSTKVTVEGHCDDRGTVEYNLALGDRRATAVKSYLQSLGVPADRIDTVTYGKERPFCTQDDEKCWAENRRGHFLITAK